ncbi:DUF4942 domain-containing protein [Burkholderia cenocepacia]|uniref:DUF4942 domain-containing protein n=1 Tax=Burkholderia cenocepacia TaxID=95486 RepID=UPI002ABDC49C|nr:DUF4942 domain-containing protein [Burkholderia cenocepacia]
MSEIVQSISIANLVNQRSAVVERVRSALDLLAEAEKLARAAHIGFPRLVIDNSYAIRGRSNNLTGEYANRAEVEKSILHTIDSTAWNYLLRESGLRTFMDAKARQSWDKQIMEGEVPELTAANVEATFTQLYGARGDMFERGVLECFRRLSWDYKTNQPFKFGKRIITTGLFSYGSPNHRVTDELDDLMRVFRVVEGKPEDDHRNGVYSMVSQSRHDRKNEAENDYVHVRWFKNGNGHVTFKRPDLVEKLNRIIAKHYPFAIAAERGR